MIKVALFCDTSKALGGIYTYCLALKKLMESSNKYSVTVFHDLPYKQRFKYFQVYDETTIASALQSDDYDIIHINGFISTIPFFLNKVIKSLNINKPIVFTPHAHPFRTLNHPFLNRLYFHFFIKPILIKANTVISINKEDSSFLLKYNKNVFTIPHWSDKKIEPKQKRLSEKPTLLFVGRNEDNKNLKILYSLPKDKYKIICVTNIKPDRDDFIFKTRISYEELLSLYAKASLTVVPSRYEAFSYAAMESLLSGTPVLISNRVRIADFLNNTSGVTIYDYENTSDFINKIDDAIKQVVDVGRVRNVFSFEKAFQSYSQIYNACVENA